MLDVLYEDNHIIVCLKPKGILSQPDKSNLISMNEIVKDYIKEKYNKPGDVYLGLLHRLDRNTEGLMIFAKTSKAASRLSLDIKEHKSFNKFYLTIVEGKLQINESKILNDKLSKNEGENKSYIDLKNGKESSLKYTVLDNIKINSHDYSLLNIELFTGRHHQIRVQMSNIGHPLLNDIKYNAHKIDNNYYFPLTSYSISFKHPTLKEEMNFKYFKPDKYFSLFYNGNDFLKHYNL